MWIFFYLQRKQLSAKSSGNLIMSSSKMTWEFFIVMSMFTPLMNPYPVQLALWIEELSYRMWSSRYFPFLVPSIGQNFCLKSDFNAVFKKLVDFASQGFLQRLAIKAILTATPAETAFINVSHMFICLYFILKYLNEGHCTRGIIWRIPRSCDWCSLWKTDSVNVVRGFEDSAAHWIPLWGNNFRSLLHRVSDLFAFLTVPSVTYIIILVTNSEWVRSESVQLLNCRRGSCTDLAGVAAGYN